MARKSITKRWTKEDIAKLQKLLDSGSSLLHAAALNRASSTVQKKARELGKAFPGVREVRANLRSSGALEQARK